MKALKILKLLIASLAVLLFLAGNAQAISFEMGGNKFLMDGYSYLMQTPDKLWGVFKVDSIKTWDPETNQFGVNYWTQGENGEYLSIKYGGLDVDISSQSNSDGLGYFENGWAELWLASDGTDPFVVDSAAGPGDDYNREDFAANMTSGTRLLDLEFAPGGIKTHEEDRLGSAYSWTTSDHTFRVNAGTGDPSTLGYLNVLGGSYAGFFDTDFFFGQFDIFIEGSNQPSTYAGWNFQANSYSAFAYGVPEPTTLVLFGTGLLGLAAICRRKINKY